MSFGKNQIVKTAVAFSAVAALSTSPTLANPNPSVNSVTETTRQEVSLVLNGYSESEKINGCVNAAVEALSKEFGGKLLEVDKIAIAKLCSDHLFELRHSGEGEVRKFFEKKIEGIKSMGDPEKQLWAAISLFALIFFLTASPFLGYGGTLRNLYVNRIPVNQAAFSVFWVGNVLGATVSYHDGAIVGGTGFLALAIMNTVVLAYNKFLLAKLSSGEWHSNVPGATAHREAIGSEVAYLHADRDGKFIASSRKFRVLFPNPNAGRETFGHVLEEIRSAISNIDKNHREIELDVDGVPKRFRVTIVPSVDNGKAIGAYAIFDEVKDAPEAV